MNTQKLDQTKNAIILMLGACGDQYLADLIAEVKVQAWPSHFPKALHELQAEGKITVDREDGETVVSLVY
jgi:hypothetical protein